MTNKRIILSALALASVVGTQAAKKPNIIFILADDMGYGDVSYLDSKSKLNTENLNKMCKEGVVFKDAHTSAAVSTPTRYGILTGRYNWRSTLKNGVLSGYSQALIAPDRSTMATMLKKADYNTAYIGKWHLGWDWAVKDGGKAAFDKVKKVDNVDYSQKVKNGPTTRGFDYSFGFCGSLDMPPYVYIENDVPTNIPTKVTSQTDPVNGGWFREGPTGDDFVHELVLPELIDRAGEYIAEKSKDKNPFFLYLPLPAPHTPILPSREFQGKSGIGAYGDFVLMVDAMVGKVFKHLKDAGCDKNTLVVFTTDNGCSPAANIDRMLEQGHSPNSIYRGHKADLFDGGHRTPCIVHYPERFKHHQVEQTICLTDFYATFASLAGYKMQDNEGEDSFDLTPVLKSVKEIKPLREGTIHHSSSGQFTIRSGEWKLLMSGSSGGWSYPHPNRDKKILATMPPIQLYNMSTDPSETTNVYDKHPEVVKQLKALMAKYISEGRSTPGKAQKNDGDYPWKQLSWMKD